MIYNAVAIAEVCCCTAVSCTIDRQQIFTAVDLIGPTPRAPPGEAPATPRTQNAGPRSADQRSKRKAQSGLWRQPAPFTRSGEMFTKKQSFRKSYKLRPLYGSRCGAGGTSESLFCGS